VGDLSTATGETAAYETVTDTGPVNTVPSWFTRGILESDRRQRFAKIKTNYIIELSMMGNSGH
jgi:hypothetical protein